MTIRIPRRALGAAALAPLLPAPAIASIWREVISACRALERRLRVGYLGPAGTFSEQAVFAQFGHEVDAVPCPSFDEVFRAAEAGTVDFNSLADTFNMLEVPPRAVGTDPRPSAK